MKRIELTKPHANPDFIGSWQLQANTICQELIDFFETHTEFQTQGRILGGLDEESKKSTDVSIRPRDLENQDHLAVKKYIKLLFECYKDYLEQWPVLRQIMPRAEIGSFNIQRYQPGGHFQKVHSERTTIGTSHRVFAWMTYLNNVEDGGSTQFVHQDIEVQPEEGKTLIWPAEWTHAHYANVLNSGLKYIITGWIHFVSEAESAES